MSRRNWIGALSLLPTLWLPDFALAAEPAPAAPVPSVREAAIQPAVPTHAEAFDLRGQAVRNIVRATAAAQAGSFRLLPESPLPGARRPNLAAALALKYRPAPRPEPTPRLPEREILKCDSFLSCGIETLIETVLGLEDNDEQTEALYQRQQRNRLMHQGVFTQSNDIDPAVSLPMSTGQMQQAGAPLQPGSR